MSLVQEKIQELNETVYRSSQRAPLGRSRNQPNTNDNTVHGIKTEKGQLRSVNMILQLFLNVENIQNVQIIKRGKQQCLKIILHAIFHCSRKYKKELMTGCCVEIKAVLTDMYSTNQGRRKPRIILHI